MNKYIVVEKEHIETIRSVVGEIYDLTNGIFDTDTEPDNADYLGELMDTLYLTFEEIKKREEKEEEENKKAKKYLEKIAKEFKEERDKEPYVVFDE